MEKVTRVDMKVTVRNWKTREEKDLYYTNSLPTWDDVYEGDLSPIKIVLISQSGTVLEISDLKGFSIGSFTPEYQNIQFSTMLDVHGFQDTKKYEDTKQFAFAHFFRAKQRKIDREKHLELIRRIYKEKQ